MIPPAELERSLRVTYVEIQEKILDEALEAIERELFLKGVLEKVNTTIDASPVSANLERRYYLGTEEKPNGNRGHTVYYVKAIDHPVNRFSRTGAKVGRADVSHIDHEGYMHPQGLFDMSDVLVVSGLLHALAKRKRTDLPDLDPSGLRSIRPAIHRRSIFS
jgi:hypothetical protein